MDGIIKILSIEKDRQLAELIARAIGVNSFAPPVIPVEFKATKREYIIGFNEDDYWDWERDNFTDGIKRIISILSAQTDYYCFCDGSTHDIWIIRDKEESNRLRRNKAEYDAAHAGELIYT